MLRTVLLFALSLVPVFAQKYRADDPLEFEPSPIPVGELAVRRLSDYYDVVTHTFSTPGELNRRSKNPIPSGGVNTLGEPLQGAWWVKRHFYRPMSLDQIVAGPGSEHAPLMQAPWTIIGAKSEGITPGFFIRDSKGDQYYVKFDPLSNPEMATGADHVAVRLLYALGYHVPENYLVELSRDSLVIGKDVKLTDRRGRKRQMDGRDLTELLQKVPRTKDGRFRATASRSIAAQPIGPYRYYGRRTDDPNDMVPHEHRRDLRGLAVASAWLGHDDSRAINTFDAVVDENGEKYVRHYILDLGSTLGSGTQKANSARSGGEYLFGWKQSATQLFSLGAAVPAWARAHYPDLPSIGRFEYERFDPETWVPEYPNPAFLNRLPDDEFWAAKQIVAIRDDEIRAIVHSARYSDPEAESWLTNCLIRRRDKIGRAYFNKVLPIDRFEIQDGKLTFDDLSAKADLGAAGPFNIQWLELDNSSGKAAPIEGASGWTLPARGAPFLLARITSDSRPNQIVDVTLRLDSDRAPAVVGIDRRW